MKILSVEDVPFHELQFDQVGAKGKVETSALPFFRATVDSLPTEIHALVIFGACSSQR